MARELAIPSILASVAAGLALFPIGSLAAESLATTDAAAESSNATSAGNAASVGLDEIVVTARKRSEDNQQAPIAITAFNTQDIQRLGITSVTDLGTQTPSLNFQQSPY